MLIKPEQMMAKGIGTMRSQVNWGSHGMIRFFSSTGFLLAPCQIIERDTSPLPEEVAEVVPLPHQQLKPLVMQLAQQPLVKKMN